MIASQSEKGLIPLNDTVKRLPRATGRKAGEVDEQARGDVTDVQRWVGVSVIWYADRFIQREREIGEQTGGRAIGCEAAVNC